MPEKGLINALDLNLLDTVYIQITWAEEFYVEIRDKNNGEMLETAGTDAQKYGKQFKGLVPEARKCLCNIGTYDLFALQPLELSTHSIHCFVVAAAAATVAVVVVVPSFSGCGLSSYHQYYHNIPDRSLLFVQKVLISSSAHLY